MRVSTIHIILISAFVLLGCGSLSAQDYPERGLVRDGNRQFERRNYRSSLNRYNEALESDSTSYEALYNRANAYHQLRHTTPADSTLNEQTSYGYYESIAADTLLTPIQRAEVLRNLGESLFSGEKYEAALNAFRESLLLNSEDAQTKYNYVLTKRIVDQKRRAQQNQDNQQNQQNQDNQQNGQNDQNSDEQRDDNGQNEQNNQNNRDNKQDEEEQQEQPNDGENEPQDGEEDGDEGDAPSEPRELSADQARVLDAVQAEEDKTQDKLKEAEKAVIIPGKKNW